MGLGCQHNRRPCNNVMWCYGSRHSAALHVQPLSTLKTVAAASFCALSQCKHSDVKMPSRRTVPPTIPSRALGSMRHAAAAFWPASWLCCSPWQDAAPHPHRARLGTTKSGEHNSRSAAMLLGISESTTLERILSSLQHQLRRCCAAAASSGVASKADTGGGLPSRMRLGGLGVADNCLLPSRMLPAMHSWTMVGHSTAARPPDRQQCFRELACCQTFNICWKCPPGTAPDSV